MNTNDVNVTVVSDDNTVTHEVFAAKDLADANLLDILRGKMSFGNKAFAIVESEKVEIVFIEQNTTVWIEPKEFFNKCLCHNA